MGIPISISNLYDDANIQGYWKFEANGKDESGNSNDLVASGTPDHIAGKFDNGADLEDGGAPKEWYYINHGDQVGLSISGSITVLAWIKVESLSDNRPIITKRDGSFDGYNLFIAPAGALYFVCTGLTTHIQVNTADGVISTGTFYQVAGVYDSVNSKLKVFVDAVKTEVVASGNIDTNTVPFAVGSQYQGGGSTPNKYFDGIVDDAVVFNRALSDAEIAYLFNNTADILKISGKSLYSTERISGVVTTEIDKVAGVTKFS